MLLTPSAILSAATSIMGISLSYIEFYGDSLKYHPLLSLGLWRRLHISSQIVFTAVVWLGTLSELLCYPAGLYPVMLSSWVPLLDNFIAVPSLALSCLSGVAMTKKMHGENVPRGIHRTMSLLLGFGAFWAAADRTTQGNEEPNAIFWVRTPINLISCGLVYALRWMMFNDMKSEKSIR